MEMGTFAKLIDWVSAFVQKIYDMLVALKEKVSSFMEGLKAE